MGNNKVRAPFNFVPVSQKVYFPKWADQITQDIPFSDGLTGYVDFRIIAKTPIFVRNGSMPDEHNDNNGASASFSKTSDGRYFIPGTSIKGAIRNVLEIMSFSKLKLDKDAMFAQREWDNDTLYPIKKNPSKLRCGYIRRNEHSEKGSEYILEDHGKPFRIGMDAIDEYLGSHLFHDHFSTESKFKIKDPSRFFKDKKYDPRTAEFKYALFGDKPYRDLSFSESDRTTEFSTRLEVNVKGSYRGDIVLTGQPDQCKWIRPEEMDQKAGKFYEFVFLDKIEGMYDVSAETIRQYEFVYSKTEGWKRYKKMLDGEGLPVFFRAENGKLQDFGLAYLYKLPYDRTPYETLPDFHTKADMDLAECIFGRITKNGNDLLKGRVWFSNAFSSNAEPDREFKLCLGTPKASYYPIYIKQNGGKHQTYNDSIISGWKRYHVRKGVWTMNSDENDVVNTSIYPLKSGSEFKCRMSFHNLRPVELGALLSALTFHDTKGCYHQIGQAKPFGFGKVSVEPGSVNAEGCVNTPVELMTKFEMLLETIPDKFDNTIKGWADSEQMKNLFTLCHDEVDANEELFKYMKMSNTPSENEFLQAKKTTDFLNYYAKMASRTISPQSLYVEEKKKLDKYAKAFEAEGDALYESKDYAKALVKYREAVAGGADINYKVEKCEYAINKERTIVLEAEAREFEKAGRLDEARCRFNEAQSLGVKYYSQDIQRIDSLLEKKDETFEQFVGEISTLPTLAGRLKKWEMIHGPLSGDEFSFIVEKIKSNGRLRPKKRDEFGKKEWRKVSASLGEEEAKRLFDRVFE